MGSGHIWAHPWTGPGAACALNSALPTRSLGRRQAPHYFACKLRSHGYAVVLGLIERFPGRASDTPAKHSAAHRQGVNLPNQEGGNVMPAASKSNDYRKLPPAKRRKLAGHAKRINGSKTLISFIRVSQETVEQSQELLRRIDDLLAKSPLKP
jgi:hypothetical protein